MYYVPEGIVTRIILSQSYNLKGCYVFVERGESHTLDRDKLGRLLVKEGGDKGKNKHGAAMWRSGGC